MKKGLILAVAVMVILSGCKKGPEITPSQTATAAVTTTPSVTPEIEKLTINGTFGGRADTNYIEIIKEDGSFESLRLSEDVRDSFEALNINEDDKVEIVYDEENGEKVVKEIIKK